MSVVIMYSFQSEAFADQSIHVKLTIPLIVLVLAQVIKMVTTNCPEYM